MVFDALDSRNGLPNFLRTCAGVSPITIPPIEISVDAIDPSPAREDSGTHNNGRSKQPLTNPLIRTLPSSGRTTSVRHDTREPIRKAT